MFLIKRLWGFNTKIPDNRHSLGCLKTIRKLYYILGVTVKQYFQQVGDAEQPITDRPSRSSRIAKILRILYPVSIFVK